MRILIVVPKYNLSINPDYIYSFPLGLAYISSAIKKTKKHIVNCLNLNHYKGTIEEIVNNVLNKEKYDVVCTGGNALAYPILKKITLVVKNHISHPLVILGGPIITSEPEIMFELINTDIAVNGEGETTIVELLNCIEKKENLNSIRGIVYKDSNNKIFITPPREPIKDIENIPLLDLEGLEFEKYLDNAPCNYAGVTQIFDYPRAYPLLGSRGCPYNCTFCWHDLKYRERSIKDIMKELELVIPRYKINFIFIHDECFSANKKRLYEFCREIKKLSKKLPWDLKWSCTLLVNNVDEEILNTMKDSGCVSVGYGFESFSSIVLKSMKKPITPEQIDFAIKATLKAKMNIRGNFIFGDIAETKETSKETLDYWKSCPEAQQTSLGFIVPYPNSEIYKYCLKKGIIKDKKDYIQNHMGLDTLLNMTEEMTNEEINKLNMELLEIYKRYFKFVSPTSLRRMNKKNVYEFNFKCPFCKKITHYKNCLFDSRFLYGFHLICRQCYMHSVLVGPIKKLAYKYYTKTRKIRDVYMHLKKIFKQKRI